MHNLYYTIRPFLPRRIQLLIRRGRIAAQLKRESGRWPILEGAGDPPSGFQGWPAGKEFALVLAHDVESSKGVAQCEQLASLDEESGFRSAFGFVPERYRVPAESRERLVERGHEVIVHGLIHDGKLFRNEKVFYQRCGPINHYLREWGARGFASPSCMHNFEWISDLNIDYDISSYDYDPFEPQGGGVGRIFPFWVQEPGRPGHGYVELPYTLAQDFTIFVLMRHDTIDVWRKKLDWIAQKGGMALLKVHPDYMSFDEGRPSSDRYPARLYSEFLEYVRSTYAGRYWNALPAEAAEFWRSHPSPNSYELNGMTHTLCTCEPCVRLRENGWFSHFTRSGTELPQGHSGAHAS